MLIFSTYIISVFVPVRHIKLIQHKKSDLDAYAGAYIIPSLTVRYLNIHVCMYGAL
jgi:hypothetical protein